MNFDYFYNRQSEMYNFIRLPMVLMEDEVFKDIYIEAKVLYSYMLNRMGLSYRNDGLMKKIVDNTNDFEKIDNLINLVGNIASKVENLERENANREKFKVSNFSIVSKDDNGNKVYTNCSAYGDKTKDLENLKQGDFIKIFGQVKPWTVFIVYRKSRDSLVVQKA